MTEDKGNTNKQKEERMVSILIFCALFIAGVSFHHPVDYDNTSSRYYLLSGIVDHGTFNIDENHQATIDKSFFNGHYYSNKAIGAPLLGVPVYWCMRHSPVMKQSAPVGPLSKYIVRVVTTTLPFALIGVVMFRLACRLGASPVKAFLMVIAYGFGTIALIHGTLFSGHQITASFAFFSFALVLYRPVNQPKYAEFVNSMRFILAGLFAGYAAITDFPAIIIAIILTVYVISMGPSFRHSILFVLGGLACAVILVFYNMKCFGNPFSLSYSHLSLEKFRTEADAGLFGINVPRLELLNALLFSVSRGIFIIMPVLLLSLVGLWAMFKDKQNRREAFLIISICISFLAFNSGYCGWHGGWTYGPRYLVPMLPFLAFAMAFGRWSCFSFLLLFSVSFLQILPAVAGMPHTPEDIRNPLIEIIIPCIAQGYLAQNAGMFLGLGGLFSLVPVLITVAVIVFVAFKKLRGISDCRTDDEPGHVRLAVYASLLMVIFLLATTKTSPETLIHSYRWRLLCHAAWIDKAPELMTAFERERALAGEAEK